MSRRSKRHKTDALDSHVNVKGTVTFVSDEDVRCHIVNVANRPYSTTVPQSCSSARRGSPSKTHAIDRKGPKGSGLLVEDDDVSDEASSPSGPLQESLLLTGGYSNEDTAGSSLFPVSKSVKGKQRASGVATAVKDGQVAVDVEETKNVLPTEKVLVAVCADSDESDHLPPSSGEEEEEGEVEDLSAIATRLNKSGDGFPDTSQDMLESYFMAHSTRSTQTSNRTMAGVTVSDGAGAGSHKEALSAYAGDVAALWDISARQFTQWLFHLANGFNILLYGLGSKRMLLESFAKCHLSSVPHIVINGYFPGLTVKQLLRAITVDVLHHAGVFKTDSECCAFITSSLGTPDSPKDLFVLIHNIDGPMLQGERVQGVLSHLASSPHVHMIASLDHINAPLMWDQWKLSRFNWTWHDVTSFEPYKVETSYENSILAKQAGKLALSSLVNVLKSLTPNSRKIYDLLVRYQLEHCDDSTYTGLSFQDFCLKCREKFLVNSDLTLRTQLTEFHDHKLVKSRKGADGVEYLTIPIDKGSLVQYLETQE